MKQTFIAITCIFLLSCGENLDKNLSSLPVDSTIIQNNASSDTGMDDMPSEYANYYIVIADTSKEYSKLQHSMFELVDKALYEIDTMNRYYDSKKDLICLPENDEDEMYRGDYFPRRSPSPTLSLEYMNFYKSSAEEKTIALVAGIYEGEGEAKVRLADVKKIIKSAFVIKSEVFVGCMH